MPKYVSCVEGGLGTIIRPGDKIAYMGITPMGKTLKAGTVVAIVEQPRYPGATYDNLVTKLKVENVNGRIVTIENHKFCVPINGVRRELA